jgi:hypothetical protein
MDVNHTIRTQSDLVQSTLRKGNIANLIGEFRNLALPAGGLRARYSILPCLALACNVSETQGSIAASRFCAQRYPCYICLSLCAGLRAVIPKK